MKPTERFTKPLFCFCSQYPHDLPSIHVKTPRGLSEAHVIRCKIKWRKMKLLTVNMHLKIPQNSCNELLFCWLK